MPTCVRREQQNSVKGISFYCFFGTRGNYGFMFCVMRQNSNGWFCGQSANKGNSGQFLRGFDGG